MIYITLTIFGSILTNIYTSMIFVIIGIYDIMNHFLVGILPVEFLNIYIDIGDEDIVNILCNMIVAIV